MKNNFKIVKTTSILAAISLAVLLTMCGGDAEVSPRNPEEVSPQIPSGKVMINPLGGLLTTEFGGKVSFTVELNSQPTGDVIIELTCSDTSEGTLDPSSLTFTSGNWDTPQTVTVAGVDDAHVDGFQVFTVITEQAISTDFNYNGINPADVLLTNIDVEAPLAAGSEHTIAIKRNGTLWVWGRNIFGQLGDGTNVDKNAPAQIGTDTDWRSVAAGGNYSLAVKTDGTLWTWGSNGYGELGDGTTTNKNTPARIGIDTDWAYVAAGYGHTVAVKPKGTLWAWGWNVYGQLGDGTTTNKNTPTRIGTDSDWVNAVAGNYNTIALKNDGSLWSWGDNEYGQLGDGTTTNKNTPTRIGTDTDWVSTALGWKYTVALKTDGTLWAWGINTYGQLGDGTTANKNTPARIGADTDWAYVCTGGFRTIALKNDGTLWAWGQNNYGKLGDGTSTDKYIPTQIDTDIDWDYVVVGSSHTVKTDGTLWAWGGNTYGQLGIGTRGWDTYKIIPTQIGPDADWASMEALAICGNNDIGFSMINVGTPPLDQTVSLVGDGVNWAVSSNEVWVQLDFLNGTAPSALSVGVDPSALTSGIHTAEVTFTDSSTGDTDTLNIELHIEPHKLVVTDRGVALSSTPSVSRLTRSVRVSENAGVSTPWTAGSDQSWLSVTTNGYTGDDLLLTADPDGLSTDTIHYATVTVSSSDFTIENTEVIRVGFWVGSTDPNAHDILTLDYTEILTDPIRPYIYMHDRGTGIDIYNVYTASLETTISNVGAELGIMDVSTDGSTLYVSDRTNNFIFPVDLDTYAVDTAWDFTGSGGHLVYGRVDNQNLVFSGNVVIDADSGTMLPDTSYDGRFMHISENGEKACYFSVGSPSFVTCFQLEYSELGSGTLTISWLGEGNTGMHANDVALTRDGSRVYTSSRSPSEFVGFDTGTMSRVHTLPAAAFPNNIEISADDLIYGGAGANVWVYDLNGIEQNSYNFSGYGILDSKLVVSGDGARMIFITDDPTIQMHTVP